MKLLLKIVGGLVLAAFLFMGGCSLLTKHIFSRQDCERFNIDNIEVRTGINIPAVSDYACECANGVKDARFTLKLNTDEELQAYIKRNKFVAEGEKYINAQTTEYSEWRAELNPENKALNIHLVYLK